MEARNKASRIKSTCSLTHQDVNFLVNLETKITFDTFLTEHIDVDSLILAAKPAHFRLPLFHVHSRLLNKYVNKCLLTYTLDYCKVGTDRNPRPLFRIVPTPPYERRFFFYFFFHKYLPGRQIFFWKNAGVFVRDAKMCVNRKLHEEGAKMETTTLALLLAVTIQHERFSESSRIRARLVSRHISIIF